MKAKNDWEEPANPWIGVDMDGTLARYDDKALPWNVFGPPIPKMVERMRRWIWEDKRVVIVTARVFPYIHDFPSNVANDALYIEQRCLVTGDRFTIGDMLQVIRDYTKEHVGVPLEATCAKDYRMLQLWDDRAIQVIPNTGVVVSDELAAREAAEHGKAQG